MKSSGGIEDIVRKTKKRKEKRIQKRKKMSHRVELRSYQKDKFNEFVRGNKKSLLVILVLILGILIVTFAAVWFVSNDNKYEIEGTAVQYYMGQKNTLEDGSYLTKGLDDSTILTSITGDCEMSSLVIYQEEEDKIILTQDMVYYNPRTGEYAKVDALSEVLYYSTGVVIKNGNKEISVNRGFLYDGDEYYVFLEPVTVSFNGYTMELGAMSYVEAIYQNHVLLFDYTTKESRIEDAGVEIIANVPAGEYTLNLLNDSYVDYNDEKKLLFSRPELLDSIFSN